MNDSDILEDATLTDRINAFKAARARGDAIDLADFLPQRGHPLFQAQRCEILRADLEFAWQKGERRLLLDYIGVFPDLLEDRATIEAVAFAEYRLRRLAGEDLSAAEYEWQYGVTTSDWPGRVVDPLLPPIVPAPDGDPKTEVALGPDQVLTRIVSPTPDVPYDGGEAEPEVETARWLHQAMNALPAIGTKFLNFDLIAELGRGGFGRVYLARQGDLAHRLVALKITVDLPGEEQTLAQLQHTNVVPIYSFHQSGDLRAVCMPYFGATTLADVVRTLRIQAKLPDSGKSLVNTVRTRRGLVPKLSLGARGPDRQKPASRGPDPLGAPNLAVEEDVPVTLTMLEETTYVEAVLWLAERLAEGLSHAHEHGILHRDLKPANILLTDDGQPMLLDFNLSTDTKPGAGLKERRVGGTLPYMAPEHLASLQGGGGRSAVDARSDVYALGVILYELLTGRPPFAAPAEPMSKAIPGMIAERKQPPPLLRPWNPAVSFGVESLVRHCLEGDPGRRYQSAGQLREDLKRQRQHRPLRHAAEPSLRERARKWLRRHPRVVSPNTLGVVTALVLALAFAPVSWQTWKKWEQRDAEREKDLVKAKADRESVQEREQRRAEARGKYGKFRDSLGSSRAVMESVNAVQVLPRFMRAWLCEEARLQGNAAKCRASLEHYEVLQRPDWQDQPMVRHLAPAEGAQLCRDVSELLYALAQAEQVRAAQVSEQVRLYDPVRGALATLGAGLDVWGAWQAAGDVHWYAALDLNERARRCCADDEIPRAVLIQQAELLRSLGKDAEAKQAWTLAEKAPVRAGTEDAYWTASSLAARGDYKKALPLLGAPEHYGAWLLRGLCLTPGFSLASLNETQAERQKALDCFTTCIVMRPNDFWAYYNRGLLNYHLNLNENAEADFDRILQKEILAQQPALATAYVQRANARHDLARYEEAEEDFTRAIALEPNVPEYYYLRARTRKELAKDAEARRDEQHVLGTTPSSAEGWTYRGIVRSATDPEGALADFDTALALDREDVLTLFVKGRLLAQGLKRNREAVKVLDKLLTVKPDYTDARTMRGLAYAALGERAPAVADAEALLKSAPLSPHLNYQAARMYALTSRQNPADARIALARLAFALRHSYGVYSYRQDPYLAPLQKMPEFERLGLGLKYLGLPP